jgi:spore coat protein U-like protein
MTMSSRIRSDVPIGLAVVAGLLLSAGPAAAQVQSQTLQVQARIGELCTVTSASLDFGPGIDIDVVNNAEGSIAIDCATETTFNVQLDGGLEPGFSGLRNMSDGESSLQYILYKDAGRSDVWAAGDQVPGPDGGTGTVPVYGTVPSQVDGHAAGLYTDEVTITLVF